jgi:hypothetical protein
MNGTDQLGENMELEIPTIIILSLTALLIAAVVATLAHVLYVAFVKRRPRWRAISPFAQFEIPTSNETRAIRLIASMGKLSYIDREQRIIFFDTQSGGASPEAGPDRAH